MFFHPQTFEKTTEGKARAVRHKLADDFERNNYRAQNKESVVETYAPYQRAIAHPSLEGRERKKRKINHQNESSVGFGGGGEGEQRGHGRQGNATRLRCNNASGSDGAACNLKCNVCNLPGGENGNKKRCRASRSPVQEEDRGKHTLTQERNSSLSAINCDCTQTPLYMLNLKPEYSLNGTFQYSVIFQEQNGGISYELDRLAFEDGLKWPFVRSGLPTQYINTITNRLHD